MEVKPAALATLERLRLLRPAYRAYERLLARRAGDETAEPVEGPPLPPAWLRVRVAGNGDAQWFVDGGKLGFETLRTTLARVDTQLEELESILDFGCGCGRVLRNLAGLPARIHGFDIDRPAIDWCRENLTFATFGVNGLRPPLDAADEQFDFAYAFSVLTHLPVDVQEAWMRELHRALKPGGLLLVSVHGDSYLPRLSSDEAAQFERGDVVVRFEDVAGTNLCTTFHPRSYVEEQLADGFEIAAFEPQGALGNPHQDVYLLRKVARG